MNCLQIARADAAEKKPAASNSTRRKVGGGEKNEFLASPSEGSKKCKCFRIKKETRAEDV